MKTFNYLIVTVILLTFLSACSNNKKQNEIPPETYDQVIKKGARISGEAQAVLLDNVSQAMQKGGPEYAIEFCNLQVSSITEDLSREHDAIIGRVSEKNRNPENNLKNDAEKKLWKHMARAVKAGNGHDTLLMMNNKLVFYRPIKTMMPACLECHGTPEEDILPSTLEKIQTLYPNDKATGYEMNEFRGLWKISFANPELQQSNP